MRVAREAPDPHYDTCMLDESIGVKELCPHGADIRAQRVRNHLLQPIRLDRLDIVVEKAQHITRRMLFRKIIN
ncbi:hypothetical protein BconGalA64_64830 [Burkholderia contaminans]|nr:hypothetical protein BconGalA64_64830 [Burkholderia contaminans]